ncbi:GAF domain-containing protein [Achromobacter sp. NFACC18-2]|uniref:GAF domain-containing protein n=1 Tax=Achromobacter sp. NFACC18-2 TaxID=1564112 RepID=UPI0008BB259D|nr:GAF domain-containing protein [Achromobacter sp. NFACC18-2]SEI60389.1 GAF domain-containing protein [Achromobacter sp. NFACC18-2]
MTVDGAAHGKGRPAGLSWAELEAFANAVAAPEPHAVLACMDRLLGRHVGHKLFTALQYRHAEGLAVRLYSSRPDVYPASGAKRIGGAPALTRMFETGRAQLAPDAAAVRADFLDASSIFALGCESVLNVPVIHRDQLLGQINLLHDARHFQPHHIDVASALAQMAVVAFR